MRHRRELHEGYNETLGMDAHGVGLEKAMARNSNVSRSQRRRLVSELDTLRQMARGSEQALRSMGGAR